MSERFGHRLLAREKTQPTSVTEYCAARRTLVPSGHRKKPDTDGNGNGDGNNPPAPPPSNENANGTESGTGKPS